MRNIPALPLLDKTLISIIFYDMVQSMTGYGRGEKNGVVVEARSLNHRFFDISIRLPKSLATLEARIKKEFQNRVSRGKFEVTITMPRETAERVLVIDKELAAKYYDLLKTLKKEFNLKGEIDISLMASISSDFITLTEAEEDPETVWKEIEGALRDSIAGLIRMRRDEGEFLKQELLGRAEAIGNRLDSIEKRCPLIVQDHREKLSGRIKSLAGEFDMDERSLHLEVALFAERCDITEEIVRVRSHLNQFRNSLESEGAIGKKLDFLLQEVGREVNTISSKANDAEVSQEVVEIKGELERMREQVQNIE